MYRTHVKPSRELRNNYSKISDILKDHDHVIITNQGKGEAVLIGIEDYAEYEEFLHRRYVAAKLVEAENRAAKPEAKWLSHEEFWDGLV